VSPRTELALTVAVCAGGAGYFAWRALTAEGDTRLTYIAFIIFGAVFAHRAIRDVLRRERAAGEGDEGAQRAREKPRGE